jgi:hypothetical protein
MQSEHTVLMQDSNQFSQRLRISTLDLTIHVMLCCQSVFSGTYTILKALAAHILDCIAATTEELYLELINIVNKENPSL